MQLTLSLFLYTLIVQAIKFCCLDISERQTFKALSFYGRIIYVALIILVNLSHGSDAIRT